MRRNSALIVSAIVLLAGCGGGGGATAPQVHTSPAAAAQNQSVAVTFSIAVPTKAGAALRRVPAYVSASTQSASLSVTHGGTTGTPVTVNCASTCTGTLTSPVGSDTFAVNLYSSTNGGGSLLSTGTLTQTIVANTANAVNVTFNGVVATLAVSLGASGAAGTSATIPLSVSAVDAAGNTIVGPGVYVNSDGTPLTISLANSDTANATALSQSSFSAPATGVTLNYTGLAIAPATLTASAPGYPSATASFAPVLQPIVVTTSDTLNPSWAGIDFYATSGAGSSGTFTASEAGYTNAPYNQTLTATAGTGCTAIGSVVQAGASFTATVATTPAAGTCIGVTLGDAAGQSQAVVLAYSAFAVTSTVQTLPVPSGVTTATITAIGAGGGGFTSEHGGAGARESATVTLTGGSSLAIIVGGGGRGNTGGGGGGGSFVFDGTGALLIAAGGGGGGANGGNAGSAASTTTVAGMGSAANPGGTNGAGGAAGANNGSSFGGGGGGGTTSAGATTAGGNASGGGQVTATNGGSVTGGVGVTGGFGGGGYGHAGGRRRRRRRLERRKRRLEQCGLCGTRRWWWRLVRHRNVDRCGDRRRRRLDNWIERLSEDRLLMAERT